jgi:four helix bundle protein
VKLSSYLQKEHKDFRVLTNQLLKSGTSIGANIEEDQAAQSKADFLAKYQIALKEARESSYWLRLLMATEKIPKAHLEKLHHECEEIKKIIASSVITGKSNVNLK